MRSSHLTLVICIVASTNFDTFTFPLVGDCFFLYFFLAWKFVHNFYIYSFLNVCFGKQVLPCRCPSLLFGVPIIPCISVWVVWIFVCRRKINSPFIPSLKNMPSPLLYLKLQCSLQNLRMHHDSEINFISKWNKNACAYRYNLYIPCNNLTYLIIF